MTLSKIKQSKEELLIEITKIRESHSGWVAGDEALRKEFAKAFKWSSKSNPFEYSRPEYEIPTWPEIFVEIGKLLALRDFRDYEGNISKLERKLEGLEKNIRKEVNPNKL